MAVRIETAVYIDGINRTSRVVQPIKLGNFLDERLDEVYLSLRNIKKESFEPLTPVEIHITTWEEFSGKVVGTKKNTVLQMLTANDNATEVRAGSGIYNHELYLIEVTKYAECVIVDSITFTNDIGRTYNDSTTFSEAICEDLD